MRAKVVRVAAAGGILIGLWIWMAARALELPAPSGLDPALGEHSAVIGAECSPGMAIGRLEPEPGRELPYQLTPAVAVTAHGQDMVPQESVEVLAVLVSLESLPGRELPYQLARAVAVTAHGQDVALRESVVVLGVASSRSSLSRVHASQASVVAGAER